MFYKKMLFNIKKQTNILTQFIKYWTVINCMVSSQTCLKIHKVIFCLLVLSVMFGCSSSDVISRDDSVLNMTNKDELDKATFEADIELDKATFEADIELDKSDIELDKSDIELDKSDIELDKSDIELDKSDIELDKSVVNSVPTIDERAVAITDDLIQFYYEEKKSGGPPTLALLPREKVESLMKEGLKTGAISITTSSEAIIAVLRHNYGFFIKPGAEKYSAFQEKRIIFGYTMAFLGAKIAGKI